MRKLMLIVVFLQSILLIAADTDERKINELPIKIDLNDSWIFQNKMSNNGLTGYNYYREPVKDKNMRDISPFMAIMYEEVPKGTNLISFSTAKRMRLSQLKIEEMLAVEGSDSEFKIKTGIGYLCSYEDSKGMAHKMFLLHIINEDKGIQIIIDGTESIFETMKDEYIKILDSIDLK